VFTTYLLTQNGVWDWFLCSLFPCQKFFSEEFCNTCAGGQKYHHEPCNTHFQGLSQWPKNATIVKQWVHGFVQRSLPWPTAFPQSFTGRVLLKINKIKIHLTPKSLSFVKVILTIKKVSFLFFHGSKKKLKINKNAQLNLKNITGMTSYKKFKSFSKHMSKIGHLEWTNKKWGSSCPKLWKNFEGLKKTF